MRILLGAVVACCLIPGLALGQCSTLTTPLTGGNALSGIMFDVRDVTGSGLDLQGVEIDSNMLAATSTTVEIYYLTTPGTHVGNETAQANWTLHEAIPVTLVAAGTGLTRIPFATPISVPPGGAPFGLYVAIADAALSFLYTNGTAVGTPIVNDGTLEIQEGSGVGYPFGLGGAVFSPRNFNGSILYSIPGLPLDYQTNSPSLSIDIDNARASACGPAVVTKNILPGQSANATLTVSSNLVGSPYEIAVSGAPLLPLSGGGLPIVPGAILNLDFFSGLTYLNGGAAPSFLPVPGALFGATTYDASFGLNNIPAGTTLSVQGFIVDPGTPAGISFSQATQLDVVQTTIPLSVPGPIGDDQTVAIDTDALQWTSNGVPFYGTNYKDLFIASNGRINFIAGDDDFTPAVATALGDNPFVGNWADLSPNAGGTITASTVGVLSELVTVSYAAVSYFGDATQTCSFDVEFNAITGEVTLNNLQGILPSSAATDQFLGLSPGAIGGATDGGAQDFSLGGGAAANPSDMLYTFNSAALASNQHAFLTTGINTILFAPLGGNYTWVSF